MEGIEDRDAIAIGSEVFGNDGEKVGNVSAVYPAYFVVEKGFFFPSDYSIPIEAVAGVDGERVHLLVTKDEALHSDWHSGRAEIEQATPGEAGYDASGTGSYATSVDQLNAGDARSNVAAALGVTGHMGESASSPGLAGDLTGQRDDDR